MRINRGRSAIPSASLTAGAHNQAPRGREDDHNLQVRQDAEPPRAIQGPRITQGLPNAKISVTRGGERIDGEDSGPTIEQVRTATRWSTPNVVTTWRDFQDNLRASGARR